LNLKKGQFKIVLFCIFFGLKKNSLEYNLRYTTLLQIVIITINTFFLLFFSRFGQKGQTGEKIILFCHSRQKRMKQEQKKTLTGD